MKKSIQRPKTRKVHTLGRRRRAARATKRKTGLPKLPAGSVQRVRGKDRPTCAAIRRNGTSYCKRPPGWHTRHPGKGRCKYHGGASTGPKNGPGTYRTIPCMEVLTPEERERYEQLMASEHPAPLNDLLAWLRIMLERQIVKSATLMEDGSSLADVSLVIDIVGSTIERISRVQKRDADIRRALQIEIKQEVLDRIVQTIKQVFDYANNLPTPEDRAQAFSDRMRVLSVRGSGEGDGTAGGIAGSVAGDSSRYH